MGRVTATVTTHNKFVNGAARDQTQDARDQTHHKFVNILTNLFKFVND